MDSTDTMLTIVLIFLRELSQSANTGKYKMSSCSNYRLLWAFLLTRFHPSPPHCLPDGVGLVSSTANICSQSAYRHR